MGSKKPDRHINSDRALGFGWECQSPISFWRSPLSSKGKLHPKIPWERNPLRSKTFQPLLNKAAFLCPNIMCSLYASPELYTSKPSPSLAYSICSNRSLFPEGRRFQCQPSRAKYKKDLSLKMGKDQAES
jgi:hypothetical protein